MATTTDTLNVWDTGAAAPARMTMTEEQFVAWCDEDTRAEWVDGEVIVMAPANVDHVDSDGWLVTVLRTFVEHHDLGRVYGPELQVRFAAQQRRRIPDVLFIAKHRLDIVKSTFVDGAPDLVIEIVSPDSQSRDWREKYIEYEAAGVREYWILDIISRQIEAYVMKDGRYARIEEQKGRLNSEAIPGFFFSPRWLEGDDLPKVAAVLRELGIGV